MSTESWCPTCGQNEKAQEKLKTMATKRGEKISQLLDKLELSQKENKASEYSKVKMREEYNTLDVLYGVTVGSRDKLAEGFLLGDKALQIARDALVKFKTEDNTLNYHGEYIGDTLANKALAEIDELTNR